MDERSMETKMDLVEHLVRQIAFSRKTFGPGERTKGVADHITKELAEVKAGYQPEYRAQEWVDVAILGLDGLWRALSIAYPCMTDRELACAICEWIEAKQTKNEGRNWPDWRTSSADHAIEHVREEANDATKHLNVEVGSDQPYQSGRREGRTVATTTKGRTACRLAERCEGHASADRH